MTEAIFFFGLVALIFAAWCLCHSYDKGYKSRDEEVARLNKAVDKTKKLGEEVTRKLKVEYDVIVAKTRKDYQETIERLETQKEKEVKEREKAEEKISALEKERDLIRDECGRAKAIIDALKKDAIKDFPTITQMLDELERNYDKSIYLSMMRNAPKSAEKVQMAHAEARRWKNDYLLVKRRMDVYTALAPWLDEYMECTVEEVLEAKREDDRRRMEQKDEDDPVKRFLTAQDYARLSEVERNQLALDRYWDNRVKKNLWLVGIQYERYVGWLYESKGYRVVYHGAMKGREDLGIDLIATKGKVTRVIQCKRYSEMKKIPVRENAVAQIFGAAKVYQYEQGGGKVIPVLYTSFELSDEARRFADALGVEVHEKETLEHYPCIKCNYSRRNGEGIYHLPFDQQYDNVVVEKNKGECYVETVQEAHLKGFRRAYKWRGGNDV